MINKNENTSNSRETDVAIKAIEAALAPMHEANKATLKFQKIKFWAIASFVASLLFMEVVGDELKEQFSLNNDYVAVVRVDGVIEPSSGASPAKVIPNLEKAFKDKGAKGIIIAINSPGGTPVASHQIRQRIIALREEFPDKNVIAVGEDMLTSGAMMVASGTDTIYADRSSIVGSIGVIIRAFGFTEVAEKYGIERRVLAAGINKSGMDQWMPLTDRQRAVLEDQLLTVHEQFINDIVESRGDRLAVEDEPEMFTGKTWPGEKAVTLGLIDGAMTLNEASEHVFGTSNMRVYSSRGSLISSLLASASIDAFNGSSISEDLIDEMTKPSYPELMLLPY